MNITLKTILIIASVFLISSCEKQDSEQKDCLTLQQNLFNKDMDKLRFAFQDGLTTYSRENLYALAARVSESCDVTATILCYDCIYTLPPQSEMKITFSYSGVPVERLIDLSSTNENFIKIVRVHD